MKRKASHGSLLDCQIYFISFGGEESPGSVLLTYTHMAIPRRIGWQRTDSVLPSPSSVPSMIMYKSNLTPAT